MDTQPLGQWTPPVVDEPDQADAGRWRRRAMFLALPAAVLAVLFAIANVTGAQAAPVVNDAVAGAVQISSLPFDYEQDVTGASNDALEDSLLCGGFSDSMSKTVWFRYTAPSDGTVIVQGVRSSYPTGFTVWQGDPSGSRIGATCGESWTSWQVSAGQTYLIGVFATEPIEGQATLRLDAVMQSE